MLAIGIDTLLRVGEFIVSSAVKIIGAARGKESDAKKHEPPHPTFKDVEHMRQQERDSVAASKAYYEKLNREQKKKPK